MGAARPLPLGRVHELHRSLPVGALDVAHGHHLDPRLTQEAPDVVQKVRILALTDAIPNDTMSFGPEFPEDLRSQIEQAIIDFSKTDAWAESIGSEDFYGWSGVDLATDEEYDIIRKLNELTGTTLENLGG